MSSSLITSTFNLLSCAVCQHQLTAPITLSCGYTICSSCFPHHAMSTFVCPVKQCKQGKHLFGPSLSTDQVIQNFLRHNFLYTDLMFFNENYGTVSALLKCPLGDHPLEHPITTHCGHSYCRLCLLQHRISHDSCSVCYKRLPGYAFTQNMPINHHLSIILPAYTQLKMQQAATPSIQFSTLANVTYEKLPIFLSEFPVLPTQKLRIPIFSAELRDALLQALVPCKEYQMLCLAVLQKSQTGYEGMTGTLVKLRNAEQRDRDLVVEIVGLDRFQVVAVHESTDNFIQADVQMRFEDKADVMPYMNTTHHWADADTKEQRGAMLPPSPSASLKDLVISSVPNMLPLSPPAEVEEEDESMCITVRLARQIHQFYSDLAHSDTSFNFCSTVEGLLGPVWLQSVQNLHGTLPSAEHPIALVWWSATVLPISNIERHQILQTESLVDRLDIILSWINDLIAQKGNGRKAAMVPVNPN